MTHEKHPSPRRLTPRRIANFVAVLAAAVLAAASAYAQTQAGVLDLVVDGTSIAGDVTLQDQVGTIAFYAFVHAPHTPIDLSGQILRGAQHRPLTIVKQIDSSSPLLWKAWTEEELVTSAEFRFLATISQSIAPFYTVTITNGHITGMSTNFPNKLDPDNDDLVPTESVTFTYDSITWTHNISGGSHNDSWSGR